MRNFMVLSLLAGMVPVGLYAACASYAKCPYCGETAALVSTKMDSAGHCVGTYAHTHQGNGARQADATVQHTFTLTQ